MGRAGMVTPVPAAQSSSAGLGVHGCLRDPHLTPHRGERQALAYQKNKALFSKRLHVHNQHPQGHDTVPPERLNAGRTQAPSSPAPGRRDPPPRPCPAGQPRPQERPPAPLPVPGPVSV